MSNKTKIIILVLAILLFGALSYLQYKPGSLVSNKIETLRMYPKLKTLMCEGNPFCSSAENIKAPAHFTQKEKIKYYVETRAAQVASPNLF